MELIDKLNQSIGTPFDSVSFHCYHFVQSILPVPNLFNIHIETAKDDVNKYRYLFEKIDTSEDFCVVLLGDKHIGVGYKDGAYHADKPSVRYETYRVLKMKYKTIEFYRIKNISK